MSFVRLEVAKPSAAGPVEILGGNGRVVRVGVGFDEGTLVRVLSIIDGGLR